MGTAVKVTRDDLTAAELRAASAKCTDGAQVRRILALALVLEGRPRTEAANLNGMDRQTLSDWVHRYNVTVASPFLLPTNLVNITDLLRGANPV